MNWQQFWQHKSVGNMLLLPLSAIFYCIVKTRRAFYRYGLLKSENPALPVIVIGNINVGGAGKTPLVIALGGLLAEHGISYAVISKGYGGNATNLVVVEDDSSANEVGDEPLLIKLKCHCPVVVSKSRTMAANYVAENFPEVKIILTDDGLQHYPLQRDMEICVINKEIGLGNGWVLPAGGLREPPSRLQQVDFVVHNGDADERHHYILADRGWYPINGGEKRYHDEFSTDKSNNLAFSGIAHPMLFFQRLKTLGIAANTRALPDHYAFTKADLPKGKTLLMTEKDWVKAKSFTHNDAWYLSVDAILSAPLKQDILNQINTLLGKS